MQALKVKEKLMRLSSAQLLFSKLNAVLQTTKTFVSSSEIAESTLSHEGAKDYRAQQLEAERLKARAEEFAQGLRQALVW